jgi:hypothetical protein
MKPLESPNAMPFITLAAARSGVQVQMPELNLTKLKQLVQAGEGLQLEFKRKAKYPEKIVKELVAFANTQGGWLLIGVDDDGSIVGCPSPDEEEYVMVKAISNYIQPSLQVGIKHIPVNGETAVLAIWVSPEQQNGPYAVVLDPTGRDRTTYIRWADESLQASRELREVLKYRKRMKQVRVQIGDKERILLQYLDQHPEGISLTAYADLANINKKVASRSLVLLALTNVLRILPAEGEDIWVLGEGFE